jgi:hypothetical protein
MAVLGRLHNDGKLSLANQVQERLPAITSGLVAHFPFDNTINKYVPSQIRYIRDYTSGSTANAGNHWVEIQAFDYMNQNVSTNKTVTGSTAAYNQPISAITNGDLNTNNWVGLDGTNQYVTIDLGGLYNISKIRVWHYNADGRTYYGTKTEVSEDGVVWHTIFDSAIEGTYAELNVGKTHDLRYLGRTVAPTNSNITTTGKGVFIEENATNLCPSGSNLDIYNNFAVPATLTKINETYMGQPVYRLAMKVTTQLAHFQATINSHGVRHNGITFAGSTKYAASIYWRPVNKSDITVQGLASNIGGWGDGGTYKQEDGWNRSFAYRSGAEPLAKTDSVFWSFISPSLQLNQTIYIDWCCPQIEQGRTHATTYTFPGAARTTGSMTISTPYIGTNNFTIIGEFISNSNSDIIGDQCIFLQLGTGVALRTYQQAPFIDTMTILGWGNNAHNDFNTSPNVRCRYVIQKNGTTFTWRMLGDDGQDITWTLTDAKVPANINFTSLNFPGTWGGRHKNMSIYNRVLSASEISTMLKRKFRIKNNGEMICDSISEGVLSIPKDAVYFPLSADTREIKHGFTPVSEAGVISTSEGAWVGTASQNLFSSPADMQNAVKGNGIFKTVVYNKDCVIYEYDYSQNQIWTYHGEHISLTVGNVYTYSMEVLITEDANIPATGTTFVANAESGLSCAFYYDNTKKGTWQQMQAIITATTTLGSIYMYPSTGTTPATTGKVLFKNVQLEPRGYRTPFSVRVKPASSLNFNLNQTMGLNWMQDLSIVYWKKPIATHTDSLTGYNIDSLGSNSNSVGGGYLWFGKTNNANTVDSSTPGTILPSEYFGRWRMVSLVKSGTTLTIKEWEQSGTIHTRTVPITVPSENYFLTQHGYDLKLGGWDNGNPVNSYYKDLVVAQRAFTDAELIAMNGKKMNSNSISTQVRHLVSENCKLT